MTLYNNKIEIKIRGQLEEAIENFQQDIVASVPSLAVRLLLTVEEKFEQLSEGESKIFNYITDKLLYITNKDVPYIDPTVKYLFMIVSFRNGDNCKKFEIVLKYIKGEIKNVRIIGSSSLDYLYTLVDATYTVHNYILGQTGITTLLVWGTLHCKSSKQKLNTKFSMGS